MINAAAEIRKTAAELEVGYRTAAYVNSINKIAHVMKGHAHMWNKPRKIID